MGETPHRLAKEASLPNLEGLSPATTNSVVVLSVPTPGKDSSFFGDSVLQLIEARLELLPSSPRGPRTGGPPNGV